MNERIDVHRACALLQQHDDILLLAHMNPDGDTLGSCFALYYALTGLGKRVRVACSDGFPQRYAFLYPQEPPAEFEPRFIVAADIADEQLFGAALEPYLGRVDLCIDHHPSNTFYARETLLRADAAATAEIVSDVLDGLGAACELRAATCIYTGIATDTGCFRFSNTKARTHTVAARMIACGVDNAAINYAMFSCKTRGRIAVEREVYNTMEYHCGGRCAIVCLTQDLLLRAGADENELDGVSSIPTQIEGVEVGVTLREKGNGFKVSVRTNNIINASDICGKLGGGGHARAAGCFVALPRAEACSKLLALIERAFAEAQA